MWPHAVPCLHPGPASLLCLVALFHLATPAIFYDDLVVKFGWGSSAAGRRHLYRVPREFLGALGAGWQRHNPPPPHRPDLRTHCPPGRALCALYDQAGFIAGLQINLPVEEFEWGGEGEPWLVKWRAGGGGGEPARDYWAAHQFFVAADSPPPTAKVGATLQESGVWVSAATPREPRRLLHIPLKEQELNNTLWMKQNCIPSMGTHYQYNMTRAMRCSALVPWFALVSQGRLVGTGFQTFGELPPPPHPQTDYFERASPNQVQRAVDIQSPSAPECMKAWGGRAGMLTLHVYYVSSPWRLRCGPGDSAQPLSIANKVALNLYRYRETALNFLNNIVHMVLPDGDEY